MAENNASKFWTYKHTIIILIAVIVCAAASIPIIIHQSNEIDRLNLEISAANKQYDQTKEVYANANDRYVKYKRFLDNCVAIKADDGTKIYHTYGCKYLNLSTGFSVYSPEIAKDKGYKACSCARFDVREQSLIVSDHESLQ